MKTHPFQACLAKRRYDLEVKAKVAALHRMNKPGRKSEVPIGVYRCQICKYWHLTSKRGIKP